MISKKGISLIVLIITIIVMIILASSVIISLNHTGIIDKAREATYKTNVQTYKDELALYVQEQLVKNTNYDVKSMMATNTTTPSITIMIPSMDELDVTKYNVIAGKLVYVGNDIDELKWSESLGMTVDLTSLTQEQYEKLFEKEIEYSASIGEEAPYEWDMMRGFITTKTVEQEKLVIPYKTDYMDIVDTIGFGAFSEQKNIKEVVFPNTVQYIETWSFDNCTSLEKINFPNNLRSLGQQAFLNCTSLKSVKLPQTVTFLDNGVFSGCTSLTELVIPKSVTYISNSPALNCTNLKNIIVDEENTNYASDDGSLFNKDKTTLMCVPAGKTGIYNVKNTVKTIGNQSFFGCDKITKVIIPSSVNSIISNAFAGCKNLEEITIPNTVTRLDGWQFVGCTNLKSVTLPDNLTTLKDLTFQSCTSLETIIIPNSVTKFESQIFYKCTSLKSIIIPKNVTSIGNIVFKDCTSLKDIYIEGTGYTSASSFGNNIFQNIAKDSTIHVKDQKTADLLNDKYDKNLTKIVIDKT